MPTTTNQMTVRIRIHIAACRFSDQEQPRPINDRTNDALNNQVNQDCFFVFVTAAEIAAPDSEYEKATMYTMLSMTCDPYSKINLVTITESPSD